MSAPIHFLNYRTPFVIAEIGGNHEGSFDRAVALTQSAARSGAHAVKFQTYRADRIVSSVEGPERNKHFSKFELSYDQFRELEAICRGMGKIFMSSLWDPESVDELDAMIPIHKVGSGDVTNYPLLKKLAKTGKPLIISTAMCTLAEVREAVKVILSANPKLVEDRALAVLQCVAMYGDPQDRFAELGALEILRREFPDLPIGYSDHTCGTYACQLAVAMGAQVLEIHFTDDKTRPFRDHALSITEEEMRQLVHTDIPRIVSMLGKYSKEPVAEIETPARIREFRRSVYVNRDVAAGTPLKPEDLCTLRPAAGIDARQYEAVLGKRLRNAKRRFEVLKDEDLTA